MNPDDSKVARTRVEDPEAFGPENPDTPYNADRRKFVKTGAAALAAGAAAMTRSANALASDEQQVERSALVLVDPYNDFLSEGGKFWPAVSKVANQVGLIENLKKLIAGARTKGARIAYAPHRRYRLGDYEDWKYRNWSHNGIRKHKGFAFGTWGGEFRDDMKPEPGDLIASEHWTSSGFANTDLNQLLRQHGIERLAIAGMLTNTCAEATGREAVENGYHVTMITDAVACLSQEEQQASISLNYPRFAHAVLTTSAYLASLS
jgi:nicotinamidase-related amidase